MKTTSLGKNHKFGVIIAIPLLAGIFSCKARHLKSDLQSSTTMVDTISCKYSFGNAGSLSRFTSLALINMGPYPKTFAIKDELKPTLSNLNPLPEDADHFIRAASALRINSENPSSVLKIIAAQDSRRKLGLASFAISLDSLQKDPALAKNLELPSISTIALDTAENIKTFDNDERDYQSFRKLRKFDLEASTTFPDGNHIFIGSGSDMQKYYKGTPSTRSSAKISSPSGTILATYDLLPFYLNLNENKDLIGDANENGPAEINFEGLAIRPQGGRHIISFFNRGNFNGNGHNAIIEYDFADWYDTLHKASSLSLADARQAWRELSVHRLVQINLPRVVSAGDVSGKSFPITINDALFGYSEGKATFFIPGGVEAAFVDAQGVHHDGVVTFAGLIKWQGVDDDAEGSTCEIMQAPGDLAPGELSKFGKVEGLAAYNPLGRDLFEKSLYSDTALVFGVNDVDSEIKPSQVSILQLQK